MKYSVRILSSQAEGLKRGGPTSEVQLHGNLTRKVSEISDVKIKVVSSGWSFTRVPGGSPSPDGDVVVYVKDITQLSLPTPFYSVRVYFCLYGPFNSISFHTFSGQLFAFSLRSSGLNSALLVFSIIYLFMKVSLSPDVINPLWLTGLKAPTN